MTRFEYPDGSYVYASETGHEFPLVSVKFPDGGLAEYRTGTPWPTTVRVSYRNLDVRGLLVDVDATVGPDGKLTTIPERIAWKTGVAGADGGDTVPAKTTATLVALVRKRAREAREACRVAAGSVRPARAKDAAAL